LIQALAALIKINLLIDTVYSIIMLFRDAGTYHQAVGVAPTIAARTKANTKRQTMKTAWQRKQNNTFMLFTGDVCNRSFT